MNDQQNIALINAAIIAISGSLIVFITYILKNLGRWIDRGITNFQTARAAQNQDEIDENKFNREQLKRLVDTVVDRDKDSRKFQDALIDYLGKDVENRAKIAASQEHLAKVVNANTKAITDNKTSLNDLEVKVGDLSDTTRKRLDVVQTDIDGIQKNVERISLSQTDTGNKIAEIYKRIIEVDLLKHTLENMLDSARKEFNTQPSDSLSITPST